MRTLLAGILLGACGLGESVTATSTSPLESTNGIGENSLTTNGVFQNGVFQNGVFQNGVFQNGVFQNGVFQNGVFQNGVFQNGLWKNDIWQNNPAALEILRTNPYARQVLQYIYECAMDQSQSTTLEPGDPPSPDAPAGDSSPVLLRGKIGLAPDWGYPGGTCDQSCQRWVSACVLARTNAYGVKVDISMRAPDDAPEHIRAALAVTEHERCAYPLREGAFYGNLFQTAPQTGEIATYRPAFYACAGPGSNIPDLTKRFCSSQGADGPITVVGTCEPRPEYPYGACEGVSPGDGALHHCFTDTVHTRGVEFTEVITVYIKEPLAVCGNSVCEETEVSDASCPSDCHPGGWTKTFPFMLDPTGGMQMPPDDPMQDYYWAGISALGPDDTVIVAGQSESTVDLGGGPLPPGPGGDHHGLLAKYDADGHYLWGRRLPPFNPDYPPEKVGGVTVDPDGNILVNGTASTGLNTFLWLVKLSPEGDLSWSMTSTTGIMGASVAPVVDRDGNVFVAGSFGDVFVAKISPAGEQRWAITIDESSSEAVTALAIDPHGDVLLGRFSDTMATGLLKLSGTTGSVIWARRGQHWAVTSDANGDVYAAGSLADPSGSGDLKDHTYDFPIPPSAGRGDFFVVKYGRDDGAVQHVHTVPMSCRSTIPNAPCQGRFDGRAIALDAAGNVIVGIHGGNRAPIDFGAGLLDTYLTKDVFIAAFSPDLKFQWVKHVPMILDGVHRGMAIDKRDRIVMSGTFAGSMLIDDRLLINNIPERRSNGNTFLATFPMASPGDVTAPVMSHVPLPMIVEATSSAGATVFFMPPTAIDAGHAGATVACAPAPSTTFPIGATLVACTASDLFGNHSTVTFSVTVVDTLGPAFGGVPSPITIEATGPAGASASFATPTALDLVDGVRGVTCDHPSGGVFPLGTTAVQCFASDASGHQTQTAFGVTVADTTPPIISVPDTIIATATSASGAVVEYAVTASDVVDGSLTASCLPASGSLFPLGTTTVTCSATDAHGNSAVRQFQVAVQLAWSGVLHPISADGTSSFKLGSTISVKFQLTGASSSITDAVATLSLVQLSPTPTGAVIEPTSTGNRTSNLFRYDASSGQYVYSLSTKPLAAGTWSLRIDLGDGLVRAVTISLRK